MSKRNHHESALQRMIAEYLRHALPRDAIFFACPNGGRMSERLRMIQAAMGERAGVADLLIIYRGQTHAIELKVKRNEAHGIPATTYQSPAQKEFEADLSRAGGFYAVCRSLDDVQQCLAHWGIPTVARAA